MKKLIFATLATLIALAAAAQEPTTLYVDLSIERTEIVAGPYARYAQKYLGVTAPLADKVLLEIVSANVNDINALAVQSAAPKTGQTAQEVRHMFPAAGFPKLLIDKTSASPEALEDSARKAAGKIFEIRRNRFELITGMAGENVFGGGLSAALAKLDELEQQYLSLFFGRQTTQITENQLRVTPQQGLATYTLAKFSSTEGLLAPDSGDGMAVTVSLRPLGSTSAVGLNTTDKPSSKTRTVRIPADAECRILLDDNELTSRTLPISQFGRTVYVLQ